jgi:4'-phosphopantetheinyl transferase
MWEPALLPADGLESGALHLWRADLDELDHIGDGVLSAEERERAYRFSSERSRERWSRCRAVLRELLGGYLTRDPAAIEFGEGERGKPSAVAAQGIEFNLSHSGRLALFGFAHDNPLGVDVELAGRVRDPLAVAEREFGDDEYERLRGLPEGEREPEFLRLWVRHEAALKCRGGGLGGPRVDDDLVLIDLNAGSGAAAAVALERAPDSIVQRELDKKRTEGDPGQVQP